MPLWLGSVVAGVNALLTVRSPRMGVAMYLLLAFTSPHVHFGSLVITYEILAIVPVTVALLITSRTVTKSWFYAFFFVYAMVVSLSTFVAVLQDGSAVEWLRYNGLFRFGVLFLLAYEALDRRLIERILLLVVALNAVIGVVQLVSPGLEELFLNLYGKDSQTVLERYAERGRIPRAPGTFGSPTNLGVFSLLTFTMAYVGLLTKNRSSRLRWMLCFAAVAGVTSLTKSFFVAAPVVLIAGWFLSAGTDLWRGKIVGRWMKVAPLLALSLCLTITVGILISTAGHSPLYYVDFLVKPASTLTTRYGPDGTLSETMAVIAKKWVLGVGMTNVSGEFIGDSAYIRVLHNSGAIGLMLWLGAFLAIGIRAARSRQNVEVLILLALLFSGLALPIFTMLPGALVFAYLMHRGEDDQSAMHGARATKTSALLPAAFAEPINPR